MPRNAPVASTVRQRSEGRCIITGANNAEAAHIIPFTTTSSVDKAKRYLEYLTDLQWIMPPEDMDLLQDLVRSRLWGGLDRAFNMIPLSSTLHTFLDRGGFCFAWAGTKTTAQEDTVTVLLQFRSLTYSKQEWKTTDVEFDESMLDCSEQQPSHPQRRNRSAPKVFNRRVDLHSDEAIAEMIARLYPDASLPDTLQAPRLQMGNVHCYSGRPILDGHIVEYPNVPLDEVEPMRLMIDLAYRFSLIFKMAGGADPAELDDDDEPSRPGTPIAAEQQQQDSLGKYLL